MTQPADDPDFADLFDELLQQLIDGHEPDLARIRTERPQLAARVDEAMAMACAVAGRRQPVAPSFAGYQVIRELGRGGMATVYLARHEALGREVALKVLPASLGLSPKSRARFHEEARALGRLQHDHIVRIHRVVEHGDMLAFEMEYVDGPSLRQVIDHLRGCGPGADLDDLARLLSVPTSQLGAGSLVEYFVRMGVQISRALHAAHQNGVVHRDVKPANLLIRRDGRPMLADFGLARGPDQGLTHSGTFAGTPTYASPEQLRAGDEAIDGRADVYSLGVTLYEAIALAPPFSGRSSTEMLRRIEEGQTVPLRARQPRVSRDLETILQKAMERLPKDRYASAAELADDLERLLQLQPIRARRAGILRRSWKFARRHRRPLLAASASALLVAAVLLPVVQRVRAAESVRAQNAALVARARVQMLAAGGRLHDWQPYVLSRRAQPRQVADRDPTLLALEKASADYAQATSAGLNDADVRLESAVLAAMLWLRTAAPAGRAPLAAAMASPQTTALFAPLPPVTVRAARLLAAGEDLAPALAQLARAMPEDRMALGLLCFLAGEYGACERSWADLDPSVAGQALRDAGLGMVYLGDARTALAYVRLYQGTRAFPDSDELSLLLAAASLGMHDAALSRHWLDRVQTPAPGSRAYRQLALLRADLAAAEGDVVAARAEYQRLSAEDHDDAMPRYRLAQSYAASGETALARKQLLDLVAEWSDVARLRLAIAQVALQLEDAPLYLAQARYVLQTGVGAERSTGEATDLLEILHAGGLDRLYRQQLQLSGRAAPARDAFALRRPVATLLPARLRPQLEELLERTAKIGSDQEAADRSARGNLVRWVWRCAAVERHLPAFLALLPPSASVVLPLLPLLLGGETGYRIENAFQLYRRRMMVAAGWQPRLQALCLGDADANLMFAAGFAAGGEHAQPQAFLLGCPPRKAAQSAGKAEVRAADDGRLLAAFASPDPDRLFGFAVAAAGDVDGDGHEDWLVGGPLGIAAAAKPGAAWLLAHDGRILRVLTGDNPGFGVSVAGIGDWNGDGVPDLAIGAAPELRNTAALGEARVYSGRDGSLLATFASDRPGVWFGACVAGVGDVDGDGHPDLAVGGNFGGAPGIVRVFAGGTGKVLHTWLDESAATAFGAVVTAAGDLDGDGCVDVAVSAPGVPAAQRPGRVLVFSGRDGSLLRTLQGLAPGDRFGQSVAAVPDLDGDGTPDLLVGAAKGGSANSGYVLLISGRTGETIYACDNPTADSAFATHLAWSRLADEAGVRVAIANASDRGLGSVVVMDLQANLPMRPSGHR